MNRVVISRHIDLRDAAPSCYGDALFSTPIPSLMAVFAGDPSAVWDRQQSEAFFDNPHNLVAGRGFRPEGSQGQRHAHIGVMG